MIDEAQVLAAPEHRQVAHSLRAGLDIRKASVKVLFAGSSEAALREMFSRASAPFYNWAPVEPFPLLGEAFVSATGWPRSSGWPSSRWPRPMPGMRSWP